MWRSVHNTHVINSTFRNSTLDKPAQNYTDVKEWPQDVKILW